MPTIFISIVKNIIMYQYFPSFFIHCSYFYSLGMQKKICLIPLPHAIPSCFSQNHRFETGRIWKLIQLPNFQSITIYPTKVSFFSRLKILNVSIILQVSVSRHCFILITLLWIHCLWMLSLKMWQNWEF